MRCIQDHRTVEALWLELQMELHENKKAEPVKVRLSSERPGGDLLSQNL
jgi:hypothetical protein